MILPFYWLPSSNFNLSYFCGFVLSCLRPMPYVSSIASVYGVFILDFPFDSFLQNRLHYVESVLLSKHYTRFDLHLKFALLLLTNTRVEMVSTIHRLETRWIALFESWELSSVQKNGKDQ